MGNRKPAAPFAGNAAVGWVDEHPPSPNPLPLKGGEGR